MKRSLAFLWVTASIANGATVLDSTQVLEFPISKDGLTRISVEQDGIDDIYYPADYADNIQHHKSGHVFIMGDDVDGPLYVTLITKRGMAQDLKLVPTRKKTEPILLKFQDEEKEKQDHQEQINSLLKSCIQGAIPSGFYPIEIGEVSRSSGAVSGVLIQAFQNAQFRILVFEIKSESGKQVLNSQAFWAEGDLAIAFDQPSIEESQGAKMFIVQHV